MTDHPRVSIGMPVYNGQNFIVETLESLLAQSYTDFELIICDNASTDGTEAICHDYATRDPRIRYHRNETNIGAPANYNLCFELARGEYFKWAAHDDLCAPTFLERCVEVLDRDPHVVLAYTQAKAIDDKGKVVKIYPGKHHFNAPEPRVRFYEYVLDPHPVVAVFGLMRRETLGHTRLIGKYAGSDRPLLSEMSLLGKFYEVPEHLFFYRFHEAQSWGGNKSAHAQQAWYDARRAGKITFPQWRLLREHIRSIERSPVGLQDRVACYLYMGYWMLKNRRRLGQNLLLRDV
ncbi:glycosyltransferase family 2 protein [Promineifilum sp.]|uniref:glycosyltransferase family 2 protein n=1 Tax=Promineifilum sp. TaxID=2664178 RepID=UPI0035B42EF3